MSGICLSPFIMICTCDNAVDKLRKGDCVTLWLSMYRLLDNVTVLVSVCILYQVFGLLCNLHFILTEVLVRLS